MEKVAFDKIASAVYEKIDALLVVGEIEKTAAEALAEIPADSTFVKMAKVYGEGVYAGETKGMEEGFAEGYKTASIHMIEFIEKVAGQEAANDLVAALQESQPAPDPVHKEVADQASNIALQRLVDEAGGEQNLVDPAQRQQVADLAENIGGNVADEEEEAQAAAKQ